MKHSNLLLMCIATLMSVGAMHAEAQNYVPQTGDKVTAEDGIYIVEGENLIPNHSFDEGLVHWTSGDGSAITADNFEVVAEGGPDGGAYLKSLGGAGSGSNKSIKQGWQLTPGKTYLFSMWAKRTASGMSSNTQYSKICAAASATGTDEQLTLVNYTADTWVQTQVVFTATADRPYCVANLGWLNSATSLDCFFLGEVQLSNELNVAKLEQLIADAEALLADTEEGDGRGQYSTEVRAALQDVINEAKNVLVGATVQAEINEACSQLEAASKVYASSANPPFSLDKKYVFVNVAAELYLTTGGGTVGIAEEDVADATQVFVFEKAPEGAAATGYNIKDAAGNYIYRSGSWDTKSGTVDLTTANAIFQIVDYVDFIQVKNMGSGSVLGVDNTAAGSAVYSNKNGTSSKNCWVIKEYVSADERDDEYNYNALLVKAQKEYSGINTALVGEDIFMYSPAAYAAYGKAIEESQAMTDYAAALLLLQEAMETFAANKMNKPDLTQKYTITQAAGNNIGYVEGATNVGLVAPTGAEAEQFILEEGAAEGAYYVKNVSAEVYLAKSTSSAWDTHWSTEKTAEAEWYITAYGAGLYTLQNVAGKGHLGSDATAEGSLLYCDKAASAANSHWIIDIYSLTRAAEKALAKAKAISASVSVGVNYWEVPQEAMDTFLEAIAYAEDAMNEIVSFEEGQAVADFLEEAIAELAASYNPISPFDTALTYILKHNSGNLLTFTASGNAKITSMAEDMKASDEQIVVLEAIDTLDMGYYIKSLQTGYYFARTGTYNTLWSETPDSAAIVQIEQLEGRYLGLKFYISGTFAGTDDNNSGSLIYSDKVGVGNPYAYWLVEPYVTVQLDREAYDEALLAAQTLLESMVPGYKKGQYTTTDIKDFGTVIATAKSAAAKAADQETLDAITAQLLADIEVYRGKANEKDIPEVYLAQLIAECQAECDATVIGIQKGQYTEAVKAAYQEAIEKAKKATAAEAEQAIGELTEARERYHGSANSVDRAALGKAVAAAETTVAGAVAGDCDGQYPAEAIDAYAKVIAEAKQKYEDVAQSQESVDAALLQLNEATKAFAAAKVIIDFAELKAIVATAKSAMTTAEPEKGEGAGKYPVAAFDALQAAIDKAAAIVGSKTVNQVTVDAECEALDKAIATFAAARVPNDYSQLRTLIAEAKALLEAVKNGQYECEEEDYEDMRASLEKNEALLYSTNQDDIDRAVKLLKRDIALFKSLITPTAIDSVEQSSWVITVDHGVLSVANLPQQASVYVYTLSGELVGEQSGVALTRGVYLVRIVAGDVAYTRKLMVE
ncbi:MAG: carbohydrate binding domain-containing protein [Bacteroidaceae bacterium]|nr:carbohydrate binding domain-containing protein [Bacteroidaceae bacterium]